MQEHCKPLLAGGIGVDLSCYSRGLAARGHPGEGKQPPAQHRPSCLVSSALGVAVPIPNGYVVLCFMTSSFKRL